MAAKKKVSKKAVAAVEMPKLPKVGKGPIAYTTSNVFKASVSRVWDAATKREHLMGHFVDDMRGDITKPGIVEWYWKEWGWWPAEVISYTRNKELVYRVAEMGGKYSITVRYEILREKNRTIFRIHESGYPTKDLKNAFMMCEGWSEFHTGIKAYLLGVDLRKG